MRSTRKTSAVLLLLALALVAMTPLVAHSAPKAAMVGADAFEPDDTTTTAKPAAGATTHTMTSGRDQDWMYIDVTTTGTPVMSEFTWREGWAIGVPLIDVLAADGSTPTVGVPGLPFGGIGLPSAFLTRAPRPGRYLINVMPIPIAPDGGGTYELFAAKKQIRRVAGADRFATAVAVSRKTWPMADAPYDQVINAVGGSQAVSPKGCIVATARGYADALAASAWVAKTGLPEDRMPILLTDAHSLNAQTGAEIQRLASGRRLTDKPFTVYVLGSKSVIDDNVIADIWYLGEGAPVAAPASEGAISHVVRVGGANRFETAARIAVREASSSKGIGDTAFIVNGFAFPDALSAGPVAARHDAPLLGVTVTNIPAATANFLAEHPGIKKAVVVGSGSVIDTSVADALAAAPYSLEVTRVGGASRWETSRKLAEFGFANYGMSALSEILVTGSNYPDGLAASGISAFTGAPVLLTPGNVLSSEVATFFAHHPTSAPSYLIGGPPAVSPAVESQFDALRPLPPN